MREKTVKFDWESKIAVVIGLSVASYIFVSLQLFTIGILPDKYLGDFVCLCRCRICSSSHSCCCAHARESQNANKQIRIVTAKRQPTIVQRNNQAAEKHDQSWSQDRIQLRANPTSPHNHYSCGGCTSKREKRSAICFAHNSLDCGRLDLNSSSLHIDRNSTALSINRQLYVTYIR